MSLYLWPPNPMPPVDILILVVVALGVILAIRHFIHEMRHPPGGIAVTNSVSPAAPQPPESTGP